MSNIKLIAIDIDGTLITDDRRLLSTTVDAIKQATQKGIKVALITGRPLVSTQQYLEQLGLSNQDDQYVAIFHGGMITSTSGKIVAKNTINFEDIAKIEKFSHTAIQGQRIFMMAQTAEDAYTTDSDINLYATLESYKNKLPIHYRTFDQLQELSQKKDFLKLMFAAEPQVIEKLQSNIPKEYYENLSITRSEPYYIDFVSKSVNKGWAINQISKKLDIKPEETMAIGDSDPDIPMIKYAGIGVAVKESTPKLLEVADVITESNNGDGVGKAILRFAIN